MSADIHFIDLKAQKERLGDRIEQAIGRVLAHGQFIMGPEVDALEERLAAFCGARFAISCASGTDALLLVLMAEGIGPGDAVFVPSFTFVATAEAPAILGATPVFVDVHPDTFTLDVSSLRAAIKDVQRLDLRPRAIIPVDLFGQPADYAAIDAVAAEDGLFVLADAAQSFGGAVGERRVGTFGKATATSFFPSKPLGCYGDGGAVFTNDAALATRVRSLRMHGRGSDKYDNLHVGINGRLDTLQAAILLEKLTIFEEELAARTRIAEQYRVSLPAAVRCQKLQDGVRSAWAQFTVVAENRASLADACRKSGVPTAIYYPRPLHLQPAYACCPTSPGGCPVAERLATRVISLPMHPYLDEAVQSHIIEAVSNAIV